MKLASLREGGRDGSLVVVTQDLSRFAPAPQAYPTMQKAIEDWKKAEPVLRKIYEELETGGGSPLDPTKLASPLPRAYQWADGSAYVNHVELVRKSRKAEMPESFWTDPLMYQGGSDSFLGPREDIEAEDEAWGIDFEAEVAIITDDVPMGVSPEQAAGHIKLIMIVNDVSLRGLIPVELKKGFGFFHGKPSSAFSPVAITPDELKNAWKDSAVHHNLKTTYNDKVFGNPHSGTDMTFNFAKLISHAAKSRPLGAGTVIGSGTVSNLDRTSGSSCILERRVIEIIENGEAKTPFMKFGDTVQIEMFDEDGKSIFGQINQKVVQYHPPR